MCCLTSNSTVKKILQTNLKTQFNAEYNIEKVGHSLKSEWNVLDEKLVQIFNNV